MTNRTIVYPAAIPQDSDILQPQINTMVAIGRLSQAVMGSTTVVDGLACVPHTIPMQVAVGPGCIFAPGLPIDTSSFGSIAANTSPLMKLGINNISTVYATPAPATAGQSVNYLIQAEFVEQDVGSTVINYYNAANPAEPYSGPSNTGTPQATLRQQSVALQLKTGAAAVTGSQTTPAVDAGWTGLWVITVAYGATAIVPGNISQYSSAPFLNYKLPMLSNFMYRTKLLPGQAFYVNATTGSDSNNGLSSTTATKTIQRAVDLIQYSYDLAGVTPLIHVADGVYTAGVSLTYLSGGPAIYIVGNPTTPSNCKIQCSAGSGAACFGAYNGFWAYISGFAVESPGAVGSSSNPYTAVVGYGLLAANEGVIVFDNIAFGPCGYAHINAGSGGRIGIAAPGATPSTPAGTWVWGSTTFTNYSIYGSAAYHVVAGATGAQVTLPWARATLTANITVTTFLYVDGGSLIWCPGYVSAWTSGLPTAFTGNFALAGHTVTGPAYSATNGGYINAYPPNLIPGTYPGSSTLETNGFGNV